MSTYYATMGSRLTSTYLSTFVDIHLSASPNAPKALEGLVGKEAEGIDFFSLPVELGPDGVKDVHSLGSLTDYEKKLLSACVGELKGNITKVWHLWHSASVER